MVVCLSLSMNLKRRRHIMDASPPVTIQHPQINRKTDYGPRCANSCATGRRKAHKSGKSATVLCWMRWRNDGQMSAIEEGGKYWYLVRASGDWLWRWLEEVSRAVTRYRRSGADRPPNRIRR